MNKIQFIIILILNLGIGIFGIITYREMNRYEYIDNSIYIKGLKIEKIYKYDKITGQSCLTVGNGIMTCVEDAEERVTKNGVKYRILP